jgi:hypothetical protein
MLIFSFIDLVLVVMYWPTDITVIRVEVEPDSKL